MLAVTATVFDSSAGNLEEAQEVQRAQSSDPTGVQQHEEKAAEQEFRHPTDQLPTAPTLMRVQWVSGRGTATHPTAIIE